MNRQISFRQYRAIDLTIMAVLLAVSQAVISIVATTVYADQLYVVSTVGTVVALVMMRWSGYAAIHAVLGGVVFAAVSGGTWKHYVIYGVGNLLGLAALLLFKVWNKETVRQDALKTMIFGFLTQLLMQLGRAAMAMLLGYTGAQSLGFITTDALSILFTICIVWAIRRVEGLFEDQKNYLLRMQRERQVEGREQF